MPQTIEKHSSLTWRRDVGYTSAVTMPEPSVRDEVSVARISRPRYVPGRQSPIAARHTYRNSPGSLLRPAAGLSSRRSCALRRVPDAPKTAERPPEPVKVAPVVQRDADLRRMGRNEVGCTANPRPRGRLPHQPEQEGTVVKAGALLFEIDPRPYQIALSQARAALDTTKSQLEQSRAQVARRGRSPRAGEPEEVALTSLLRRWRRDRSASRSWTTPSRTTWRTWPLSRPRRSTCSTHAPMWRDSRRRSPGRMDSRMPSSS